MTNRIQEWVAEQWFNKQPGGTPITAERLTRIEEQIEGITLDMNAEDTAPEVTSVNGETGDVVLDIAFPVSSVNSETGAVVLDAADVGAAPAVHNHDAAYIPKGDITAIDVLTQTEYDAIDPKVATTLYVIRPA